LIRAGLGSATSSEAIARLAKACPARVAGALFDALAGSNNPQAALLVLAKVPASELRSYIKVRLGTQSVDIETRKVAIRERAARASADERVLLRYVSRGHDDTGLGSDEAESEAVAALADPSSASPSAGARRLLEQIAARERGDEGARALLALHHGTPLSAAAVRPLFEADEGNGALYLLKSASTFLSDQTVQLGLRHRRAVVRKSAIRVAAFRAELRPIIAELARSDSTPSVRIVAVKFLAAKRDSFAREVLSELLEDRTDTSDNAPHGISRDDDAFLEFGIANTARRLLEEGDWPK
jgi:hypothetical protein